MNGLAPGSGDRKAVPTIGDLIALAGGTGSGAAASGAATGAAAAGAAWAGAGAAVAGAASRLTLILRSPSATSISVSWFFESSSASLLTIAVSMRIGLFGSVEILGSAPVLSAIVISLKESAQSLSEPRRSVQCQYLAARPENLYRAFPHCGDQAAAAEAFADGRIGQVNLNHRDRDRRDGVADGDRCVGVAARVEDHRFGPARARFVQPVDQMTLVIRLSDIELHAKLCGAFGQRRRNIVERFAAINLRFARAEQ